MTSHMVHAARLHCNMHLLMQFTTLAVQGPAALPIPLDHDLYLVCCPRLRCWLWPSSWAPNWPRRPPTSSHCMRRCVRSCMLECACVLYWGGWG